MCRIPNGLKIPFFLMENIFFQFADKFLKFEETEYLVHRVKFKMLPALRYVNYIFIPDSSTDFKNGIYECWS